MAKGKKKRSEEFSISEDYEDSFEGQSEEKKGNNEEEQLKPLDVKKKKRVKYDVKKDPFIAKANAEEDDDVAKEDLKEITTEILKPKTAKGCCPSAPQKSQPTNMFCINVYPDELNVRPVAPLVQPKKKQHKPAAESHPSTVDSEKLKVNKNETAEERAERKKLIKQMKDLKKNKKKETKEIFETTKNAILKDQKSKANIVNNPGVSIYQL